MTVIAPSNHAQPSVLALVTLALEAHEYLIELGRHEDPAQRAATCAGLALETWCHDHDVPPETVAPALRVLTAWVLTSLGRREQEMHIAAEEQAAIELAEAIEAGDVDSDGHWKPYPNNWSV
jgi:hypothetical protein